MPRCAPLAGLIRAGLAAQKNSRSEAVAHLEQSAAGFDREAMRLHAAVTRRRLGRLLASDRGQAMIREAEDWMTTQGIKNPERMTELLAPGFDDTKKNRL
jgi:eukaryotic-like serine/threonine-protein kinase